MGKGRKLLLATLLALLMSILCGTALADSYRFGVVDGGKTVNLRAGASTSSRWLGSYEEGTWMQILGESGNFYRVKGPDGRTGYMSKNFVYISAGAKGTIGIVSNAGYLNLRKSASTSAKSIGQYDDGTPCILLSQKNGWYHVSVDGKIGYFSSQYIKTKYMAYSPDVATVVTRNGGSLRMRKGPGTSYSSVRSFKNGSYVMILQKGDGWWKVAADGYVGYMDSSFLKDGIVRKSTSSSGSSSSGSSSSSSGSSSSSSGAYAVVDNPGTGQKLYLRQAATKSSKSLGKYGDGTRVTMLMQGTEWCKVKVDGKTGYMMTEYLSLRNLPKTPTMKVDHPQRTYVNLRNAPSQETGRVLVKVCHNKTVTVLVPGDTWTKVRYNGYTGYMMTKFLED